MCRVTCDWILFYFAQANKDVLYFYTAQLPFFKFNLKPLNQLTANQFKIIFLFLTA